MDYITLIFWTLIGSVFSLVGGFALLTLKKSRRKAILLALPFGAGALIAAAFLNLIPEAAEAMGGNVTNVVYWTLGGFLAFFIMERFLGWFHHHHDAHHHDHATKENKTHATLVIIGDTVHNAIDGVAIGAAFAVNPAAGIATALAVAAHEIPQEIGDFGILLGKGMRPRNVIIVNILSALATVVTAVTTYALSTKLELNVGFLMAMAAGFFIYVAASDIIPEIHEGPKKRANIQALMLLLGVVVIGAILTFAPHSHEHTREKDAHDAAHGEHHLEH